MTRHRADRLATVRKGRCDALEPEWGMDWEWVRR